MNQSEVFGFYKYILFKKYIIYNPEFSLESVIEIPIRKYVLIFPFITSDSMVTKF